MSVFEWLFKSRKSSSVGDYTEQRGSSLGTPRIVTIIYMLIAITALGIPFYVAGFPMDLQQEWGLYLGIMAGEIFYLMVGYFLNIQPDTSNIGWFGGLMNNPFRISDNFNRFLVFFKILLLPGRLISVAILNFVVLLAEEDLI